MIVEVMLKPEIHDPQGEAIASACRRLGFGQVLGVRQGKRFEVELDGPADQDAVTAVSELARNALVHGGGGEVCVDSLRQGSLRGVRLVVSDQGPGIEDIAQALTDGHTTGRGLGLGLGGSRRLVDDFTIESAPGQGTTVTIAMWAAPGRAPIRSRLAVRS